MSQKNTDSFSEEEDLKSVKEEVALEEAKKEYAKLLSKKEVNKVSKDTKDTKDTNDTNENTDDKRQEREFTALELEQMEHGWDPDKPDGVSAKEFKRVGEIIEAKRQASKKADIASKELEELSRNMKMLIEHNKMIEETTRQQVLQEIEEKKLAAVEAGDVKAFKLAEAEKLAKLAEQAKASAVVAPKPLSEEVIKFQEENKEWLTGKKPGDLAMQAYVKARVDDYMSNNPNIDERVAIQSIKDGLAEEFPHKFTNTKAEKPSKTLKSTTNGDKSNYGVSRLNLQQKQLLESIKQADPSYTVEKFIKQLEKAGQLDK